MTSNDISVFNNPQAVEMTSNDIINKLKKDPSFLIDVIAFNNPQAVAMKFKDIIEIQNDDPDLLADELQNFLASGETSNLEYCVNVPFINENANDTLLEAVETLRAQYYGDSKTRVDSFSSGLWNIITHQDSAIDTTTTVNTPNGTFSASVSEVKEDKKVVYKVLGAAVLLGIIIYAIKKYK